MLLLYLCLAAHTAYAGERTLKWDGGELAPRGMIVDTDGELYVASAAGAGILSIDQDGRLATLPGSKASLSGLAFSTTLFATGSNSSVVRYDPTMELLVTQTCPGAAQTSAVARVGDFLYVTDSGAGAIFRADVNLTQCALWMNATSIGWHLGPASLGQGQLTSIVKVDDGHLLVTSAWEQGIRLLDIKAKASTLVPGTARFSCDDVAIDGRSLFCLRSAANAVELHQFDENWNSLTEFEIVSLAGPEDASLAVSLALQGHSVLVLTAEKGNQGSACSLFPCGPFKLDQTTFQAWPPTCHPPETEMSSSGGVRYLYLSVVFLLTLTIFVCVLWWLMYRVGVARSHGFQLKRLVDDEDEDVGPISAQHLEQVFFKKHLLGTLAYRLTMMFVAAVVILDWINALDRYFHWFFADSDCAFITLCWWWIWWWNFMAVVLAGFRIFHQRWQTFFLMPTEARTAEYVMVQGDTPAQILVNDKGCVHSYSLWLRAFASRFEQLAGSGNSVLPVQTKGLDRFFVYQLQRYTFVDEHDAFVWVTVELGKRYTDLSLRQGGLSQEIAEDRLRNTGANSIDIPIPSLPRAVASEFFQFFYIYQYALFTMMVFSLYWRVGGALMLMVLVSGALSIFYKRKAQFEIREMVHSDDKVTALRSGHWVRLHCYSLVVGDVVAVQNGTIPCDLLLLQGQVVVDESMLTGESMPVAKSNMEHASTEEYHLQGAGKKHTLFSGTSILGADSGDTNVPVGTRLAQLSPGTPTALVVGTGVATTKGELISSILSPSTIVFKFDEHMRVVMSLLCVYAFVVLWVTAAQMRLIGDPNGFLYGLYRVITVIPILMPTTFVVASAKGAGAMRKNDIFCTNPKRIMVTGKIRIFCFDKTGTLTCPGLDFLGAQCAEGRAFQPLGARHDGVWSPTLLMGLACTHSITEMRDQLVGNSVDMRMFEATGCRLERGLAVRDDAYSQEETATHGSTAKELIHDPQTDTTFSIRRRFDFDHVRMTMVSIVSCGDETPTIFVKGAYERIASLCSPDTLPDNYKEQTEKLSREGCYVLAIASKPVPVGTAILDVTRDECEADLTCLGIIVFRNQLKPDTRDALEAIRAGDIRPVMITGDNEITGVYVARESGMIAQDKKVMTGRVVHSAVEWTDEEGVIHPKLPGELDGEDEAWELAMTGECFRLLHAAGRLNPRILFMTRVFARMKPQDKVECCQLHMQEAITGMCGDGGNDCGALRAAHAGIALSDAEASVVSPFSSKNHSIWSVVTLIRHGRATLATSFASYKTIILWGQVNTVLALFKNYYFVSMLEVNWVINDLFLCLLLTFAVANANPHKKLGGRRPTISLLGWTTIGSCAGLVLINLMFNFIVYGVLSSQSWYHLFDHSHVPPQKWWLLGKNYEAGHMFLLMETQVSICAGVFNIGGTFRAPWHHNILLLFTLGLVAVFISWLTMRSDAFTCALYINCPGDIGVTLMPVAYRWKLLMMLAANCLAVVLWESVVIMGPIANHCRKKRAHKKRIPYFRL